ncbi:MAG TPA: SDR family oxidoreductase [Candidatus Binataceae bacterium]|nr:SDR family oxidoreductase [Candidatus Binataceae bacterium]
MDPNNPFDIKGKVTIVTGGATGIGASIAREFAIRGAPVLIASRKEENLIKMRDRIRAEGGRCEMTVCDVREPAGCEAMIAEAVSRFGRIDVLINNAGAGFPTSTPKLSPNGWRTVLGINLDGPFFCSKAAAAQFIAQDSGGCIINVSSESAIEGWSEMPHYSAAKAGVINLTLSHASEWGPKGIRVNCIIPGKIVTETENPLWLDPRASRHIALRRFGKVDEIAFPCIFLASDAASFITGTTLAITGGKNNGFG